MPEPIVYHCINCGVCCNRLLIDRQEVRKGLPLLPDEVELFRKAQIRPAYGVGASLKDPGFEVIAYTGTDPTDNSKWLFKSVGTDPTVRTLIKTIAPSVSAAVVHASVRAVYA